MRPLFRIEPAGPAAAYKTYGIVAPRSTHSRPATCVEVDCPHYRHGWACTVAAGSDDEAIVRRCGRRFTCEPAGGGMIRFVFVAGQPCFKASTHRIRLDREPLYIVRGGDWRGDPRGEGVRRHQRAEDWVDDFACHQDMVATRRQGG